MKKRRQLCVTFAILSAVFTILLLSSCANVDDGRDDNTSKGTDESVSKYFDCAYEQMTTEYDLSDVWLAFTYGYFDHGSSEAVREFLLHKYRDDEEKTAKIWAGQELAPVPMYLYFYSFGRTYYIKTIDDFFSEEYRDAGHMEEIKVPSEAFNNEYGRVVFFFTDEPDPTLPRLSVSVQGKEYCSFYYKKTGDSVQISSSDLNPESKSFKTYFRERKETGDIPKNAGSEDGSAGGFVERNSLKYEGGPYDKIPKYEIKENYGAAWLKLDQYGDEATADFYFGSRFDGEYEAAELYFVTDEGEERFVKRIEDYAAANYGVFVEKYYDYDGNEQVADVRFAHHEVLSIPYDILTERRGVVYLEIRLKKSESERIEERIVGISYFHCFEDFTDERPYNRLNLYVCAP